MENNNVLYNLILGLARLKPDIDGGRVLRLVCPYPSQLQLSMHYLALYMRENFPRTLTGFLQLLENPLKDWWPQELTLPAEFSPQASIMLAGDLSEIATEQYYEWLEDGDATAVPSLKLGIQAHDNMRVRKIFNALRKNYLDDQEQRETASQEYVMIREFLIRNPYATASDFRQKLRGLTLVEIKDIGEMYQPVNSPGPYWKCLNCGPLTLKAGNLAGIKPSVCNVHYFGAPNVVEVPPPTTGESLRVLRPGVHIRTHIPGIIELRLYDWLLTQKEKYDNTLQVSLWPGIDRYDLRIEFSDGEVWAVDVKDYKDPYSLARKIEKLYNEGTLSHDKGFYVFPSYRLEQQSGYQEIVEREVALREVNVPVVSDQHFMSLVGSKLENLKKVQDSGRSRKQSKAIGVSLREKKSEEEE